MTKKIPLAILSGIILVLAFPPFRMGFLALFAFVPLFFALDGLDRKRSFALAYVFGFIFFLGTVYWVIHSMYYYGGVPLPVSIGIMLLLVLYLSIYAGLFGLSLSIVSGIEKMSALAVIPALWVAFEYIRGYLLTGFPWVLVGYTQASYSPVVQIADTTGVWGLSFLILAVNTALFFIARHFVKKDGKFPIKESAIAFAMLLSVISYGFIKISQTEKDMRIWTGMKMALAQGSIDQGVKWDVAYREKTLQIYKALTINAARAGAKFIVWPETAIPFYFEEDKIKGGTVGETLKETGSYLLTGSPSYNYNLETRKINYYNSAFLLSPAGDVLGRYDKMHLVPFGEYVPLKSFLPMKKVTDDMEDFIEGKGPIPISFEGGGIGMLICYESIFPEIARNEVKNGATVLVNITNDGWFGRTSAPYQHFQMALLRAVENRAYVLRAANTGISAIIDPVGRVTKRTNLFEKAVLADNIRFRQGKPTFYTAYGDVFAYGCLAIAGIFIILRINRR